MTLKSGTGQACAACKHQRRRCTPECLLAPFFPADQPKMFENVHRLFGVKNILRTLEELDPDQKVMAVKSMKFQATMRDKYPVYGCLVEIQQLTYQIQLAEEELHAVLQQLAYYRQHHHLQQRQEITSSTNDYISQLQLGMPAPPPTSADATAVPQESTTSHYNNSFVSSLPTAMHAPYNSNNDAINADHYLDNSRDNNVFHSFWIQQPNGNNSDNDNTDSMIMQSQLINASSDLSV